MISLTKIVNQIKYKKYIIGTNILLIVNSDKIDSTLVASILDEVDKCEKVNILLTEGFEAHTLSILNMIKFKIDSLFIINCAEWTKLRFYLNFCPKQLFIINNDMIDIEKFAKL